MDDHKLSTTPIELPSESELIYQHWTTVNPLDIQRGDIVPENNTEGVDGIYLLYGLGGILVFFVIYMLIYSYLIRCKEAAQRQEIELRQLNERVSRLADDFPMHESRVFGRTGSTSLTMQAASGFGFSPQRKTDNLNAGKNEKQDNIRIMDLPQTSFNAPEEILGRKCLPEANLCQTSTKIEVPLQSSGAVSKINENPNTLGRNESWMSVPPLGFSTPHDSYERVFSPEDFKDLCPNSAQIQKCETSNERKSDADNSTPTKGEKQSSTSKRKSRSSPTSPDIVRRRLTTTQDSPRRPETWHKFL